MIKWLTKKIAEHLVASEAFPGILVSEASIRSTFFDQISRGITRVAEDAAKMVAEDSIVKSVSEHIDNAFRDSPANDNILNQVNLGWKRQNVQSRIRQSIEYSILNIIDDKAKHTGAMIRDSLADEFNSEVFVDSVISRINRKQLRPSSDQ